MRLLFRVPTMGLLGQTLKSEQPYPKSNAYVNSDDLNISEYLI